MTASSQIFRVNNIFIQLHNQHQAAMQDFARQSTQYDIQAGLYTQTLSRAHTHKQLDSAIAGEGWCRRSLNRRFYTSQQTESRYHINETCLQFTFAFRGPITQRALFS